MFANSRLSFSRSLEYFFLTVGQNNFGNKIPLFGDTVFWLASLHLWGNARNCGRQLSAQDLLLWVSRTLVQFRTNKTKSNLIENIMGA